MVGFGCDTLSGGGGDDVVGGGGDDGVSQEFLFVRADPTSEDPNGNSSALNCGDDQFLDATARLIVSNDGRDLEIEVRGARPNTLFTGWLRLKGNDAAGVAFGGSPITGKGSTPLAPSSELDELLELMGEGNGQPEAANAFTTDENGNGNLRVTLDNSLFGGAYPFQNFEGFDPTDDRFPIEPSLYPVAIVVPDGELITAPFTVRLSAHCTDDLAHGLVQGDRETWWNWPVP